MAFDEARLGLINWHKRRYRRVGERPEWIVRRCYKWTWLYTAIEPATGKEFCMYLPALSGQCFELFLEQLAEHFSNDTIVLVLDNAPAHCWKAANIPKNIVLLPLPPYSPELNPAERLFQELRKELANRLFDSLDAIEQATTDFLTRFWRDRTALKRLTGFPWWLAALEVLGL